MQSQVWRHPTNGSTAPSLSSPSSSHFSCLASSKVPRRSQICACLVLRVIKPAPSFLVDVCSGGSRCVESVMAVCNDCTKTIVQQRTKCGPGHVPRCGTGTGSGAGTSADAKVLVGDGDVSRLRERGCAACSRCPRAPAVLNVSVSAELHERVWALSFESELDVQLSSLWSSVRGNASSLHGANAHQHGRVRAGKARALNCAVCAIICIPRQAEQARPAYYRHTA